MSATALLYINILCNKDSGLAYAQVQWGEADKQTH